jgi:hypothetical protein
MQLNLIRFFLRIIYDLIEISLKLDKQFQQNEHLR